MAKSNFGGLRVLALESRRAQEIAKLIANCGGEPLVAPSVREVRLESNHEALDFVRALSASQVDIAIFMTGAGVRVLVRAVEVACPREQFAGLLNKVTVIARGPKPAVALREIGVTVDRLVPEPSTWRDLLAMFDEKQDSVSLKGRRIALQEYGITNPELSNALKERGAAVIPVCVYEWALPEDTGPLREAVMAVIRGDVHVMLVASSIQIRHLFQVAESMGRRAELRAALARVVIASIGPLTSEELCGRGLSVDMECTHPKMGILVQEAAQRSAELLEQKRNASLHAAGSEKQ